MQQHDIQSFLERFFTATHCTILEHSDGHIRVQLTVDMDKQLMNRPFYWHYVERIGAIGEPLQLSLMTRQSATKEGEYIHFGSPRLHQIFSIAKMNGRFVRLYEQVCERSVALHPWLHTNILLSYECDRKQDRLLSLGIHLISGTIIESFYDVLKEKQWTATVPDYCFTISPLIKPLSGLARLEAFVERLISSETHHWADEARARWKEELALLQHFYEGIEEKREEYEKEKEALRQRYEPRIHISIINGGLFYLQAK
ncbi:YqhG family protein [Anoxybacillus flavithermus]|uniref:YqhG family protein n=1 Tax=Anoxybacillus flavithermus TaxID=33934 RepID=UPI0007D8D5AE|nr:YqhG family protein [Anoxybacillus flavithermus]MBE2912154.1 hypothetical protein [Anoxybacillus flavithermus]OAO82771.1 Conserved protein YqhG [Anoxybacillus flavithermus]